MAFDFRETIISQYANSTVLVRLITDFADYLNEDVNMDAFYDLIWNLLTAQGYGLDVLGRIVGVKRTYQIASTTRNLGFEEATTLNADPWNQTPFYRGPSLAGSFSLSDDDYRGVIATKAMANITDGSIPSLNALLLRLFPGRGNAYVTDDGDMEMTYTFTYSLTPQEFAVLTQSGIMSRPAGVKATVVQP